MTSALHAVPTNINDDHRSRCAALGDQLRADLTRAGISPRLMAHFGDNHSTTASLQVAGGVVTITATAYGTFPLALGVKQGGQVEMLTEDGSWVFSGREVRSVHTYPETSPGIFRQGEDLTLISYQTLSGSVLVEAVSAEGQVLFGAEFPNVLSVDCHGDRFFVLTASELFVLDEKGTILTSLKTTASRILVSAEIVLLRGDSFAEVLELSLPS